MATAGPDVARAYLRGLGFDDALIARVERARKSLNTTVPQLIQTVTMQGLDELEGYAREEDAIRRFYDGG